MKTGEFLVLWTLLTTMACLAAGMEAANRSWPPPSQERMDAAAEHLQQAAMTVGYSTSAMVIALVLAWCAICILGAVAGLMVLVEAVRLVRADAAKRRAELAEAQARTSRGDGE